MEGRGEHDKLLVGRRIVGNGDAVLLEDTSDASGHGDGMASYLEVKLIRKQGVKLDAEHSALGQ